MALELTARRDLEARLGHAFSDPDLLERALTHTSAVAPSKRIARSYQRLEFLGDRVLGLVAAEVLFAAHPQANEGGLSRTLNAVVRKESCAAVAQALELGRAVRLGDSEARSGGAEKPAILADTCEAVIGAIFLDGGLEAARRFVEEYFGDWLFAGLKTRGDAKTALQEWAQSRGLEPPSYEEVERSGPDHAPEFEIEINLAGFEPVAARGRSKKQAEHAAATEFLLREKVWKHPR